jgi:hypothetical protein
MLAVPTLKNSGRTFSKISRFDASLNVLGDSSQNNKENQSEIKAAKNGDGIFIFGVAVSEKWKKAKKFEIEGIFLKIWYFL